GSNAWSDAGADTGTRARLHAEPLAFVSDTQLSHLGPSGLLPARRRIWIPRSDSGLHGAHGEPSGAGARASDGGGRAAVSGGRRAALVASADWPWRANALLR